MPTTNPSGRQTLTGKDGVTLERRYLYLKPETWAALYALVQAAGSNQSTILETLIATAGKEITDHDTLARN
jgi:hypothetical protein